MNDEAVLELDWTARIEVSRHALDRALERIGQHATADEISREIRVGLILDRVATVMPDWIEPPRRSLPSRQRDLARYVWDEWASRAWVVLPNHDGRTLLVKTMLLAHDLRSVNAGVKTGMSR